MEIAEKYPDLDFTECHETWDYEAHSADAATARAERVRAALAALPEQFTQVMLITHRGFIAYLVQGLHFDTCGGWDAVVPEDKCGRC